MCKFCFIRPTNGEIRPLVLDKPVELEKARVQVEVTLPVILEESTKHTINQ